MWKVRAKSDGVNLGILFLKSLDGKEKVFNNKEQAETDAKKMIAVMNANVRKPTHNYWAVQV